MRRRDVLNTGPGPAESDPATAESSAATTGADTSRTVRTAPAPSSLSASTLADDNNSHVNNDNTHDHSDNNNNNNNRNNNHKGNNIVYNGRSYEGTGRLPRDAPFTPSYVNAYTVNSAIAFVSLIVTATFFYFKIVVGLLESPQIGGMSDREFSTFPYMGPMDAGDPRPMLSPVCPSLSSPGSMAQGGASGEDCVMFGKIVVLADSISRFGYSHAVHGWVGYLSDEWAGRADVVLRSFPGYNTHWIKSIFPDLLYQETQASSSSSSSSTDGTAAVPGSPVKLVIIALGTDDAASPHTRQHVSLEAYKANLQSLVSSIRYPDSPNYSPDTQIILVTPGPVDDEMWRSSLEAIGEPVDRTNNMTREYVEACIQVGEEVHVPVVDIWSVVMCQVQGTCELHESDQLKDYLMDGLHPKRMGNEVIYKGIMNTVAHHFPHLHPACWPVVFPGYVGGSNPEQSDLQRHCTSHRPK